MGMGNQIQGGRYKMSVQGLIYVDNFMFDPSDLQAQVADAVALRGYRSGWSAEQFVTRQVAKLQEELAEMAHVAYLPSPLDDMVTDAGACARSAFDDKGAWSSALAKVDDYEALRDEAADVMVVLLTLAEAIGEATNNPFDILSAALQKAEADTKRGVRMSNVKEIK